MITFCSFCNSKIKRKPYRMINNKLHFCNMSCKNEWQKDNLQGLANPNYDNKWSEEQKLQASLRMDKDKKIKYTCEKCGIEYKRYKGNKDWKTHYCSSKCYGTAEIKVDINQFKSYYDKGFNDKEIASLLNISSLKVRRLRLEYNLPSNFNFKKLTLKQKEKLQKYGVTFEWNELNAVKPHSNETAEHWMSKAALTYLLITNKKEVVTEAVTHEGVIDVYNLTDRIVYEIESNLTEKKKKQKFNQLFNSEIMQDFFIFKLQDIPKGDTEKVKYFANKLGLKSAGRYLADNFIILR